MFYLYPLLQFPGRGLGSVIFDKETSKTVTEYPNSECVSWIIVTLFSFAHFSAIFIFTRVVYTYLPRSETWESTLAQAHEGLPKS